eukprot:TRINITY_DN7058_c0_g1_i1.p1 TRINITY_DN7058_c0_g1~~TRINITY_DN7058_c0_g1_i1.p1  ORF type:complete len:351 (+),score=64.05 TRINITY_DN7058_c0_g1_i1:105-1157(+)
MKWMSVMLWATIGVIVMAVIALGVNSSPVATGQLYGYRYDNTTHSNQIFSIQPSTGMAKQVCQIASPYYGLSGSSQSVVAATGELLFAGVKDGKQAVLVFIHPPSCHLRVVAVQKQTNLADFTKYDNKRSKLYMAYHNEDCMHASLDHIDPANGTVIRSLADVIDTPPANDQFAIDEVNNKLRYWYLTWTEGYALTAIDLASGSSNQVGLNFDRVGGFQQFDYAQFTINYISQAKPDQLLGVSTFVNKSSPCYPIGYYSISTPATGNGTMRCLASLPGSAVPPLAAVDHNKGMYYQVVDTTTLATFATPTTATDAAAATAVPDTKPQQQHLLLSKVQCAMCAHFTAMAFV